MTNEVVMRKMTQRVAEGCPLLVGESVGPNGDRMQPLEGNVGKIIADLAGVAFERYLEVFARVNLLSVFPGLDESGATAFSIRSGRHAARHITNDLRDDYVSRIGNREPLPAPAKVICLGRRVAASFGLAETRNWFEWSPLGNGPPGCRVAVVPHPLGSLPWWSEPENLTLAGGFFRGLLPASEHRAAAS